MSTLMAPVSIGELADKITILEIKAERIGDAQKLVNVRTELDGLLPLWAPLADKQPEMAELKTALREANTRMWDVQDALRAKEAAQDFGDEFIELARAVARHNGDRIEVKNTINRLAGSRFVEEKQYRA
ncbi:DUF6165 family protein [Luteimonas fraxinea]|uniref:DUF6165 family protein n=1 Tax=Luteimonas fraxinea TaxID=2901869 RepID=A0ABS8UA95_9GAMM|nr:DUF6165 family protein [Luteimonas fraxinea]MCD9096417.1 DUF6165 family protein [Luteimonas fraxinea]UHH10210.1 DUF6165 family protein [Luteimonas fraxinea]